MGQEFFVKSDTLEEKVRQILPSQGGLGAGFDLSASTQIIPIVDLTESAEGSTLRQDLQSAFSHDNTTTYNIINTASNIITNTGYWRLFGNISCTNIGSSTDATISLTDGATVKELINTSLGSVFGTGQSQIAQILPYDFIVKTNAGDSVTVSSGSTNIGIIGCFRQIATIDGELV
tara:strand:- start:257 stop:784 length:528 start_codon:yes stop_codon:yes gene_type:complete